ncbi:hypothetical protein HKD37_20G057784 [Glycine soja]
MAQLGSVKVKVLVFIVTVVDSSAATNEVRICAGIMSKEVDMDYQNEEECGVNEPHVDYSDAFNTSHVFDSREDVLWWARSVAHENGFVAVIIRCRKKEFVRRDTETRKCECPFKLHDKPVVGEQGWMVKLMCEIHNHELAKSLVGHPYVGRLTKAEKTLIVDMMKSMVKPRNILLTLKEHNANSYTTIKQIYNARSAYRSFIRESDTEMQHLMKLLERDQYIHWHRLKNEDVILPTKQTGTDSHCSILLGVTPIEMTFFASLAYMNGERLNNVVWTLERFQGIFLRRDVLLGVIVTKRDLALMNAVKTVFTECTNLLCSFHINKNVKVKCKSLISQRNVWETWIILHKKKFVFARTNKMIHLENTTTNNKQTWLTPQRFSSPFRQTLTFALILSDNSLADSPLRSKAETPA